METIPKNVLDWLIEEENPSIRYRTMREIQNIPSTDKKMIKTQQSILQTSTIKKLGNQCILKAIGQLKSMMEEL